MITTLLQGARAWERGDVHDEDWLVSLSEACLYELQETLQHLRAELVYGILGIGA